MFQPKEITGVFNPSVHNLLWRIFMLVCKYLPHCNWLRIANVCTVICVLVVVGAHGSGASLGRRYSPGPADNEAQCIDRLIRWQAYEQLCLCVWFAHLVTLSDSLPLSHTYIQWAQSSSPLEPNTLSFSSWAWLEENSCQGVRWRSG